ncbi:cystine ABC transporter [Klebsiella pneumoniae]|uniref:Cystine ABC transporter n=1 Tax=Klebsiella pneumoniae TaxID=573 RepID=A0A378ACV8_KLEPN|nr:cystine ABC transporter [Klebsiella pneumoniae]
MSAIEVKSLVKKFHGQTVLHGIDLEVQKGEVVAIIGPSGSGKTTLLRSINLLEQPESGTIRVGDVTIDAGRSLGRRKGSFASCASTSALSSRTLICFPTVRCWRTLLKAGHRKR